MNESLVILATLLVLSPNTENALVKPDPPDATTDAVAAGSDGDSAARSETGEANSVIASDVPSIWASIADLGDESSAALWSRIHEIRTRLPQPLAPESLEELSTLFQRTEFRGAPAQVRFAAAALARSISRDPALRARALSELISIAESPSKKRTSNGDVRLDAVRLLGESRELDEVIPVLSEILEASQDPDRPYLRIAAVLALDRLDSTTSPLPVLKLLRDEERGFDVRVEAALALAQMTPRGSADPLIVVFLRKIRREPTARGQLARLLMSRLARGDDGAPDLFERLDELERENRDLARRVAKLQVAGGGPDALAELLALVRRHFVDPGQVDEEALAITAIDAVASKLDHVQFLSPDDIERLRARSVGHHLGLGAEFFKLDRSAPLVVVRSFHPRRAVAADRRLSTGDRISAVDGVSTRGITPSEIRAIIRRKEPGEVVQLEVERSGWEGPRWIPIELGAVDMPLVESELFPENVAYLRIARFSAETADVAASAIAALEFESGRPLRGFILDLRDNPGGLLEEAVRIVDLFVDDDGLPIVTQVDRNGSTAQTYHPNDGRAVHCSMIVLTNDSTASSAEVVAGSLQDLGRARVVGENTFGKGVSQQRYETPASVNRLVGGEAGISLPNYYLHLPSGRRFHRPRDGHGRALSGSTGGIVPDVIVRMPVDLLSEDESNEYLRVRHADALYDYLRESFSALESSWNRDPHSLLGKASYAKFQELCRELETTLEPGHVRRALRAAFRERLDEERRRSFETMLQDDPQIQRALLELGLDPRSSPVYAKWLTEKTGEE